MSIRLLPSCHAVLRQWSALCLLWLAGTALLATEFADRSVTQWDPFLEWSVSTTGYSGNPFDVVASATFVHSASGETRTTEFFYDDNDIFRFRFCGTRQGEWTFTTSSTDAADLDGHSGRIAVTANPGARGFLTATGTQFAVMRDDPTDLEALVFNVMMNDPVVELIDAWDDPATRTTAFDMADELGLPVVYTRLYHHVLSFGARTWNEHSSSDPDPRTFALIETVITEARARGLRMHFHAWGDSSRKLSPAGLDGGVNGIADRRQQRYLAARLGCMPGWSMGLGWDIMEWASSAQGASWGDYINSHSGWPHLLCARKEGSFNANEALPLSSYDIRGEHDYQTARDGLLAYAEPALNERRRNHQRDGMSMATTRRVLWRWAMAGQMGEMIGYRGDSTPIYPQPEQLRTHGVFWNDHNRMKIGMQPVTVADGYALATNDRRFWVVYAEDSDGLSIDLSEAPADRHIVAVDTVTDYAEVDLGTVTSGPFAWNAPYQSDWALAIGDSSGPNSAPTITAVAADPATVTGTTTGLSVSASDADGDSLSYVWTTTESPSDANPAIASGEDPTVTFDRAGDYRFTVSVTDGRGGSDSDSVTVRVLQTAFELQLEP